MVQAENLTWEWHWYWGATAVITGVTIIFWRGCRRTRIAACRPHLFVFGLLLLIVAWLSPLNHLASQLFSARVIQRILVIGLVPFLLLLSNPSPILYAGLPGRTRHTLANLPQQYPRFYQTLITATKPSVIWLFFVCVVWLWYDEKLHQFTLQYEWLHRFELGVILVAALLYWWHILAVTPHLHQPMQPVMRILYVFMGSGPVKIVGFVLLFSSQTIYNYPASLQFSGLQLTDQNVGGILIWTCGGVVFTWTAVYLAREWIGLEEKKPSLPHTIWSNDDSMSAPGIRRRFTAPSRLSVRYDKKT